MTGIEGIGWSPTSSRVTGRARTGSGFSVPSETAGPDRSSQAAPAESVALTSLLTVQEAGGESVQDREARRHGKDMLAALADLQRALLAGNDDPDVLRRLTTLADTVPCATDRRLAAMIQAIVLRVRVELARRQA